MKFIQLLVLSVLVSFGVISHASVNINMADKQALATELSGVGQAKAQAIIDYREANGPFKTIDDLLAVKGIGKALLEKNEQKIQV